jgi:hypothetical protein
MLWEIQTEYLNYQKGQPMRADLFDALLVARICKPICKAFVFFFFLESIRNQWFTDGVMTNLRNSMGP